MPLFLSRPGHPKANRFGMVDASEVDDHEVKLAVAGEGHVAVVGDSHYDQITSPIDGKLLDTRKKHREYLKQNGLAMYDDFKDTWAKEQKRRDDVRSGHFDNKQRQEAIARAWYENTEKGVKKKTPTVSVENMPSSLPVNGETLTFKNPDAGAAPVKLSGDM